MINPVMLDFDMEVELSKALEIQNRFREDLLLVLETLGISQGKLAKKLGTDHQTVNYWINRRSLPRLHYQRIAIQRTATLIRHPELKKVLDEIEGLNEKTN